MADSLEPYEGGLVGPEGGQYVAVGGKASLALWAVIIVSGRMIAYNWFDCGRQPQSDFINWATGCEAGESRIPNP